MLPRDDNHDNPFTSYDYYKGYCSDDNADDDVIADDWGVNPDYLYYELQEDSPQQKKLIKERKRNSRLLKELSWFKHRFYQADIDKYLDEIHDNDKNIDEFHAHYLGEKGI